MQIQGFWCYSPYLETPENHFQKQILLYNLAEIVCWSDLNRKTDRPQLKVFVHLGAASHHSLKLMVHLYHSVSQSVTERRGYRAGLPVKGDILCSFLLLGMSFLDVYMEC